MGSAIDLLFAASETVEKVHQAAWFALLGRSGLLHELIDVPASTPLVVEWEPAAGLFDLGVTAGDVSVWIELKVDSGLGEAQLKRQLECVERGRVVHVLLGLSHARSRPWTTKRATDGGSTVLGPARVHEALLEVAGASDLEPGVRALAQAYAGQIDKLRRRGEDFRTTERWSSAHSVYLFDQLRQDCAPMRDAVIVYVPSRGGGFEGCHWGWADAGEGRRCYLQWEDTKLCIKIRVEQRSVRAAIRAQAAEFLSDCALAGWALERPQRLGSGRHMTVGYLTTLPIEDEARWPEVVAAAADGTRVVAALAEHLATHPASV